MKLALDPGLALFTCPIVSNKVSSVSATERENRSKGSLKPAQPLHGHIPFSDAFIVIDHSLLSFSM